MREPRARAEYQSVILSLTQNHGFLRSGSRVGARDDRIGAFWMRNVEELLPMLSRRTGP
ncbi:protein of unknown function [Mesotoga infera]|uniref:Uncharacterized protein n=1 Tax=Mesotoga infera TaxID=1236046 RepID=A0A7Z7LHR6_9BACT|nr:protein of unknown function [Mesotoga infera]